MNAAKLNVVIAHAEPLIRLGLESALSRCADFHVQMGGEPTRASYDVAITDLDFGVALARSTPACAGRVLIVTSDESEVGIRSAMDAGIRGYLLARSTPDSVTHAVRLVAQGGTAIDPLALSRMIDSLNGDRLTDRQLDVLCLITQGQPNKSVARQLGITVGTVKCHMKQVMAKLNARSRTEAAAIAQRRGLVPQERTRGYNSRTESVTSSIEAGAR